MSAFKGSVEIVSEVVIPFRMQWLPVFTY
jgi:hypothetical protein